MDNETIVKCPGCTVGTISISTEETNIPHFGKVVVSTMKCLDCGYRSSDVLPVESRTPKRFTVQIKNSDDLVIRVIRSSSSSIIIPEIGVRIDPGSVNEGYITNVEGVLVKIISILSQILRDLYAYPSHYEDTEVRINRTKDLMSRLERITSGKMKDDDILTFKLEDPNGNSAIVSDVADITQEELSDQEIMDLLGRIYSKEVSKLDQTPL
jgi:zinc finger protein